MQDFIFRITPNIEEHDFNFKTNELIEFENKCLTKCPEDYVLYEMDYYLIS